MNPKLDLSVILCTHNPRADFLRRTVDSLQAQTMPADRWEFLVIDNGSREPLEGRIDLSWHPRARVVREEKLGLTVARLRGISEARADLLIFVDDDNVLNPDYLAVAARFGTEHPFLGAWGGASIGEFETPPPSWARPYLCYLAIREVPRTTWSNEYRYDLAPIGAGLCIRLTVAATYSNLLATDSKRQALGRQGTSLVSGEDSDMAFVALASGFGIGLCAELSLRHLMPAGRLELVYLERLLEGIGFSSVIVFAFHGVNAARSTKRSRVDRCLLAYRLWRQPVAVRRLEAARARGEARAWAELTT